MSAFQHALADFLRLNQAEEALAADADDESLDADRLAAWRLTQAAFDRLFAMPAENGSQAAAKMAALASYYVVPGCGCDPQGWAMLVAEVVRFSAVDARAGVA